MKARFDVDRVFGGVALLLLHEADSLQGHAAALRERLRVAADARSLRQLWREQRALGTRTLRRLREDRAIRRELWRGLRQDFRARPAGSQN